MVNESEIRKIVIKVLEEENLHNFVETFKKEHNLFRGTHETVLTKIKAFVQDKEPESPFPGLIWLDTSGPGAEAQDEFIKLTDTPASYAEGGGKGVAVNSEENGLEFKALIDEFKELIDTPSSYTGQGSKVVSVKATEDGLEFITPSGDGVNPAFYAYQGADTNDVTGDGTNYPVIFNTEIYDIGANYNPATGLFTAPIDGRYVFSFCVLYDDLELDTYEAMGTTFVSSNRGYKCEYADGKGYDNQGRKSQTATVTCEMDANDTIYINAYVWGGAKTVDIRGHATLQYTYFNGAQLC